MNHRYLGNLWRVGRVAAALVFVAGAARGGAIEPRHVPADTAWFVHFDLETLRDGEMGAFLLEQMARPPIASRIDAAAALFRVDVREGLASVTAFAPADRPEAAALLLSGNFDIEHLTTVVRGAPEHAAAAHHGDLVHSWQHERPDGEAQTLFGAFDGPTRLVLASDESAIQQALDILRGRAPSLAGQADRLPRRAEDPALLTVAVTNPGAALPADARSTLIRDARGGSLVITEAVGRVTAHMRLTAPDAERAQQLVEVVRGMAALVQLEADAPPMLVEIARNLRVQAEGAELRLRVAAPAHRLVAQLREWMDAAGGELPTLP